MAPMDGQPPEWLTFYYDPLLQLNFHAGGPVGLALGFFLAPQQPAVARRLYEGARAQLGWDQLGAPGPGLASSPRNLTLGLVLAREFGDRATYAKLRRHAEAHYGPTWDRERGEFYYRFGLDEPYPRGQWNATIMLAEVGDEGAWWRLFNQPHLRKFHEPTVHGVDSARLGVSQAYYDPDRRALAISTYPLDPSVVGQETSFRVKHLGGATRYTVYADDQPSKRWRPVDGELAIATTVDTHTFLIFEAAPV